MDAQQINQFLKEDAPEGDITTKAIFGSSKQQAKAQIVAKEALVVSGFTAVLELLKAKFPRLKLKILNKDGAAVKKGSILARVYGPVQDLLVAERMPKEWNSQLQLKRI